MSLCFWLPLPGRPALVDRGVGDVGQALLDGLEFGMPIPRGVLPEYNANLIDLIVGEMEWGEATESSHHCFDHVVLALVWLWHLDVGGFVDE